MGGKYDRVIQLARDIDKQIFGVMSFGIGPKHDLVVDLHALLKELPEDEPIFILRAQDRSAPKAVRAWIMFAEREGADDVTVSSGVKVEGQMLEWQEANSLKVRVPTTPLKTEEAARVE